MKMIQLWLAVIISCMSLMWIMLNVDALVNTHALFAWRSLLLQYTGLLAMTVMSIGMLLAIRIAWIENKLNGLDKVYRLHKLLGITALVFAIFHWLTFNVPKWLVDAGYYIRPPRSPRAIETVEIFNYFNSQRGLAEQIGEYAFYALLALITIALIKRFPYRYFFMTHRWIALIYLLLILHAVVLMNYAYWTTLLGVAMATLMLFGMISAVISLFRHIGLSRKVAGEVTNIRYHDGVKVNAVSIQLKSQWPGHYAGQFAFITFDQHEGAHPFSITSVWAGDGKLSFLIKALGDYTSTINTQLKVGDIAVVEGPYGRFNFEGESARQIWIAGGIGITPFIARMKALAVQSDGRLIDLFHTSSDLDDDALQLLKSDALSAGVRLHVMISSKDGRLNGERLREKIPDWQVAEIWFCGPLLFGKAMRNDLIKHGMSAGNFHQELFEMR